MVELFGRKLSRQEIREYMGSLDSAAGITRFQYDEGRSKGLSAVEMRTGTGFRFVVLPDRGLDIGLCEYRGIPLSYRAPLGESHPSYFEAGADNWLRNFGGGLLVTCGLSYLGEPVVDRGEKLGLHGRINNLPAYQVNTFKEWHDEKCRFKISGKIRESKTLVSNLVMYRSICTYAGENRIYLEDRVVNEGFKRQPHMILYHFNLGHPLLDNGTILKIDPVKTRQRDNYDLEEYYIYKGPDGDYPDTVFYHQLPEDRQGYCQALLVNKKLNLGFSLKFEKKNLPNFIQWKYTNRGFYVTGLEPANCLVEGRKKEREEGTLVFLEPGEEKIYRLEISVSQI